MENGATEKKISPCVIERSVKVYEYLLQQTTRKTISEISQDLELSSKASYDAVNYLVRKGKVKIVATYHNVTMRAGPYIKTKRQRVYTYEVRKNA